MSAYLCDNNHISYLIAAAGWVAKRHRGDFYWFEDGQGFTLTESNAMEAGQMLREENLKSLDYLYGESDPDFGPMEYEETATFTREAYFDLVQIIKAVKCYRYHSCEHPGWRDSGARNFTDGLLDLAIMLLPGYEEAEWGSPELPIDRLVSISRAA